MTLVREVGYAQAFSFKYSARPGTPAAAARRQIPDAVKDARLQALQALLTEQQHGKRVARAAFIEGACCSVRSACNAWSGRPSRRRNLPPRRRAGVPDGTILNEKASRTTSRTRVMSLRNHYRFRGKPTMKSDDSAMSRRACACANDVKIIRAV